MEAILMLEIHFSAEQVPGKGFSDLIQMENVPAKGEPNRECADVLRALVSHDYLAIDFPNQPIKIAGILKKLGVHYMQDAAILSVRISPKSDKELLRNIFRFCGYTSQQFAVGSEGQIDEYLREAQRISKFSDLYNNLICIGEIECYKDRIAFTTKFAPAIIQERLKTLPYQLNWKS
jgi:hypothetical protein